MHHYNDGLAVLLEIIGIYSEHYTNLLKYVRGKNAEFLIVK